MEKVDAGLPSNKEDLERFFAERFVAAFNQHKTFPGVEITNLQQQDTSDLDFRIDCRRAKYLELAELTPLSEVFGKAALASGRLGTLEYATWIYEKVIRKKFENYGTELADQTFLLLYPTYSQFYPAAQLISCLRSLCFWRASKFNAVFLFTTTGGSVTEALEMINVVSPVTLNQIPPRPEAFKGLWWVNTDHLVRPLEDGNFGFMLDVRRGPLP